MTGARSEGGFTMVATIIGIAAISALALVALTAVRGDIHLTAHDLGSKRAYEAAKAGIDDYSYHIYADSLYWKNCTDLEGPNAVNQKGSTARRLAVPGDPQAEYAIELLPAEGQTECEPDNPIESMLESSGPATGSFRIRSTGFADGQRASVVATFKRPSFLDYMYFTQLETSDPVTYGYPNPSPALEGAYSQCTLTWQQGRYDDPIPGTDHDHCNKISFIGEDAIEGPLHTNDALAICGDPTFGRDSLDMIEVSAHEPGWYPTDDSYSCSNSNPHFLGTYVTDAPVLTPPPTNSQLAYIAQPQFRFTGQVRICLNGTNMTVGTGSGCTGAYSGSIPSNGVVYVANGACSEAYSPLDTHYPTTSGCGNVYVEGDYSGQLTIAAENDIVVKDDLDRSGNGILGLIANNFVRVYHPCSSYYGNLNGFVKNLRIDAAILAINHSFIVDNYECGSPLGDLHVDGAIAQKFRGPVGTYSKYGAASGYAKAYVYDDRLRYLEPPNFLEPEGSTWVIGRETSD
jgi:hypothetical protein